MSIDGVFHLGDSDRAHFLAALMHSLGCSYVCLWLHSSPQNYLQSKDGYYHEDLIHQQAKSSSYGSLASQSFDEYRLQTVFLLENECSLVPGLAFKQTSPCIVLSELDLHRLASSEIQLQFYLEARIKTTVFMGCRSGEIELGMSTTPQINIEMELSKLFPEDFRSLNLPLPHELQMPFQETQQQNRPSSSSSNHMESSEYSSFLFNTTATREDPLMINQSNTTRDPMNSLNYHHSHLTQQAFPTPESVEVAIVGAKLTVLSSSTSTSHSLPGVVQESNNLDQSRIRDKLSAFKEFNGAFRSSNQVHASSTSFHRKNMMKKALTFYRGLTRRRFQEQLLQGMRRPSIIHLQHVLKERKRRAELNEHFEALRSLLPLGTKKNKATTLRATKDYMRSLQYEILELGRRKHLLESQLSSLKDTNRGGFSSDETFRVRLTPVGTESSSDQERRMDLQLSTRADGILFSDFVTRLLGFLKGVQQVKLVSMEAQYLMATSSNEEQQPYSVNGVTFRITIEESDWDQSAFLEAVRRVIADLAPER